MAKTITSSLGEEIGRKLRPTQLGFGTPGGCEAAVHASRRFLASAEVDKKTLLKLDYRNAFNTLRRDVLLTVVKEEFPKLFPFIWQLYSSPSSLMFGDVILQSATGVQQGDPLGPALFSLSLLSLTKSLSSPLNIWYLDDGTIGGSADDVFNDFVTIITSSSTLGLELNISKCELYIPEPDLSTSEDIRAKFFSVAPAL